MSYGFTFNNKHNFDDFGVSLIEKQILPPNKVKIKESVPFMNGSYDFSTVGSGGDQVFSERYVNVILGLPTTSKEELYNLYSDILNWLQDTGKQKLIFDDILGYYFLAEVEEVPDFEEAFVFGVISIKFTCEPFKISINDEGARNILWDNFNFNADLLQETQFDIITFGDITLYNSGRPIIPKITSDKNVSLYLNGKRFDIKIGENSFYGLKLDTGINIITVVGTTRLKFTFHKEIL